MAISVIILPSTHRNVQSSVPKSRVSFQPARDLKKNDPYHRIMCRSWMSHYPFNFHFSISAFPFRKTFTITYVSPRYMRYAEH